MKQTPAPPAPINDLPCTGTHFCLRCNRPLDAPNFLRCACYPEVFKCNDCGRFWPWSDSKMRLGNTTRWKRDYSCPECRARAKARKYQREYTRAARAAEASAERAKRNHPLHKWILASHKQTVLMRHYASRSEPGSPQEDYYIRWLDASVERTEWLQSHLNAGTRLVDLPKVIRDGIKPNGEHLARLISEPRRLELRDLALRLKHRRAYAVWRAALRP